MKASGQGFLGIRTIVWIMTVTVLGLMGGVFAFSHQGDLRAIPTKTVVAAEAREFLAEPVVETKNFSSGTGKREEVSCTAKAVFHADLNTMREQLRKKLEEEKQKQQ